MIFYTKCIFHSSQIYRTWNPLTYASSLLFLHKIDLSYLRRKSFSSNSALEKYSVKENSEIPHALPKYELFSEKTDAIILDVEEERQKFLNIADQDNEFEGINLKRGVTGVFDIEEIVELLRKEKAEDIFVGKIPSERNYAGYMVIVNGRSTKHMLAMCNLTRRIYKKKLNVNKEIPCVEGKNSKTWMALDLGNIILHVFSRDGRKMYDLETLWSVGKEYDSLTQRKGNSPQNILIDCKKILASLSPNT